MGKAIVQAWSGERGFMILIFYFFLLLWRGSSIIVDNVFLEKPMTVYGLPIIIG
jgi:hypothetical protein